MNINEIKKFFNASEDSHPEITDEKELVLTFLKASFGFPLKLPVEEFEIEHTFTEEQSLNLFNEYVPKIINGDFPSVSMLMLSIDRDLDKMFDETLDD